MKILRGTCVANSLWGLIKTQCHVREQHLGKCLCVFPSRLMCESLWPSGLFIKCCLLGLNHHKNSLWGKKKPCTLQLLFTHSWVKKNKLLLLLLDFSSNFSVISSLYSTNHDAQCWFVIARSKLQFESLQAAPKSTEYDFPIFIAQILVFIVLQSFAGW